MCEIKVMLVVTIFYRINFSAKSWFFIFFYVILAQFIILHKKAKNFWQKCQLLKLSEIDIMKRLAIFARYLMIQTIEHYGWRVSTRQNFCRSELMMLALTSIDMFLTNPQVGVKRSNVEILDGELVVIAGPSGAGKTKLLRAIAGIELFKGAQIYFDEKKVTQESAKRREVTVVYGNSKLFPGFTAYDNIAFGLKARGFSKDEISEKIAFSTEIVGATDLLHTVSDELSQLQIFEVLLAKALVSSPKILIIDDVFSLVPIEDSGAAVEKIKDICAKLGCMAICSVKTMADAVKFGTKIFVMDDGVIQQIGNADEIVSMPTNIFVKNFISDGKVCFLPCKVSETDEAVTLKFADGVVELPTPKFSVTERMRAHNLNSDFLLAIEPGQVRVSPDGCFSAGVIEVFEENGAKFVSLKCQGGELIARVPPGMKLDKRQKIKFSLDLDEISIFYKDTRNNLLS
jgi:multiple sugar transport system ATP-binding protein